MEHCSKYVYAILRILVGFSLFFHGGQKIFGWFGDGGPDMWSQLWIGGIIEIVTGVLLMIGFFTKYAAFLASGTMAVAYIQFHWKFQFNKAFFPFYNEGELALIYAFLLLYIFLQGAGPWSIDKATSEKS